MKTLNDRALEDSLARLETIYDKQVTGGGNPELTAKEWLAGEDAEVARILLASLINRYAWDGRISHRAADWAAKQEGALDEATMVKKFIYTKIHLAHFDQIARQAMQILDE